MDVHLRYSRVAVIETAKVRLATIILGPGPPGNSRESTIMKFPAGIPVNFEYYIHLYSPIYMVAEIRKKQQQLQKERKKETLLLHQ